MSARPHVQIFLSCVTDEFKSYRDELARLLDRPNVSVKVQENFIPTGNDTLDKLDDYIQGCDAVVHLAGDMTGGMAKAPAVTGIRTRYPDLAAKLPALCPALDTGSPPLSYTQWEAYLAVYHRKRLFICVPESSAPRDAGFKKDDAQRAQQEAHLQRLRALGRYPEIRFANSDKLTIQLLRSALHEILPPAVGFRRPVSLPYPSLGTLFKGRDDFLARLRASLAGAAGGRATAIVGKALHGLGGVGKTRLAVEFAWRHVDDYSALLFVAAATPQELRSNLAGLAGPLVLDLPEGAEAAEEARLAAALRWLREHPGWFLILDNIDTPEAAAAAEELLARLHGGQVLITGRLTQWGGWVEPLELDVLGAGDAAAFLLERTGRGRRKRATDAADAAALAGELDGLALALEQAGAYIVQRRLSLADYLRDWRGHVPEVQGWHDERLMRYPRSVAVTWQTTMAQLGPGEAALLGLLAWLAPEPLPRFVLEGERAAARWQQAVGLVGQDSAAPAAGDLRGALVTLADYSMVRWDAQSDPETVAVHRVVQEVVRNRLA